MLLMIATVLMLVLSAWAGKIAMRLALWRGLLAAALPFVGVALISVTGNSLAGFAALLPLAYFAYQNRGSEYDIRLPLIGLIGAMWFWGNAAESSRLAAAADYEAQVAEFRKRNDADVARAAETAAQWPARAAKLKRHGGKLKLADTGAVLTVPAHWHFIEAEPLRDALAGTKHFPGLGVIGWLVHERVDIANLDTLWYVEVYSEHRGHVKADGADDGDLQERKGQATAKINAKSFAEGAPSFSFVKFADLPKYDALYDRAVWVDQMSYPGETDLLLDCYSIKLGKESQVWFRMREQFEGARELCVRSVRMMAAKTTFEPGQGYGDYTWLMDDSAGFDLGEVIASEHRVED